MDEAVTLIDFENAAEDVEKWIKALGLHEGLDADAKLLLELNWASTGPGIDWPESYYLQRDPSGARWVLWSRDGDDPFEVARTVYPLARVESDTPASEAAQDLLAAYWMAMRDRYDQHRFESVRKVGLLTDAEVELLADAVWGKR